MYDILSVFSVLYPTLIKDHCASVFSSGLGIACDDGSGQHAKYLTLDVRRGELPDGPTLFEHLIPWGSVYWVFFSTYLLDRERTYILAGDETVVSKSGSSTYGLSRFFSSRHGNNDTKFSVLVFVVSERQGTTFLPTGYGASRAWHPCVGGKGFTR